MKRSRRSFSCRLEADGSGVPASRPRIAGWILAGYQKEALIEDGVIDEIIQIERHIHQGKIDPILL